MQRSVISSPRLSFGGCLAYIVRQTRLEGVLVLDDTDRRIIRLLQANARATNRDIAADLGVAPSTSIERVRSLQARGVITGYRAEVDLAAIGRAAQALIAVRIRPPSRTNIEGFRLWVSQLPETVGVFITSGAQDFLIHIAVPDIDGLYAFVIDRLTAREEVADVTTSVVYDHLRTTHVEPPLGQVHPRDTTATHPQQQQFDQPTQRAPPTRGPGQARPSGSAPRA